MSRTYTLIASLPSQMVELRRFSRLLHKYNINVRLYVEQTALLSEPGASMLPEGALQPSSWWTRLAERLSGSSFVHTVFASVATAKYDLQHSRTDSLVVCEDGVGGNLAWIAAAQSLRIPIIIVPYEYSTIQQAITALKPSISDYLVTGWVGFIFSILNPAWVRIINGCRVLRLPLRYSLAYVFAGVAPRLPWSVHGGRANIILAESLQMQKHYRQEGISAKKIRLTGSLGFDDLFVALQSRSVRNGQLKTLCALPPDYTVSRGPCSYPELISSWLDTASKFGEMIIQAHPSARPSLDKINISYRHEDITTLIAECDILITSVSSIIRYALAAGIPVLNYDCYRFCYPDYLDAPGCTTVQSFASYHEALSNLCLRYTEHQQKAASDAYRWGLVDGKASERIAELLSLKPEAY